MDKLPTHFTLGAVKWSISFDNDLLEKEQAVGMSQHHSCEIKLSDKFKGHTRSADIIEQTLYHEVVHAILNNMEEHDLSSNEKFVQGFGSLLHQFEKSKEYNK